MFFYSHQIYSVEGINADSLEKYCIQQKLLFCSVWCALWRLAGDREGKYRELRSGHLAATGLVFAGGWLGLFDRSAGCSPDAVSPCQGTLRQRDLSPGFTLERNGDFTSPRAGGECCLEDAEHAPAKVHGVGSSAAEMPEAGFKMIF